MQRTRCHKITEKKEKGVHIMKKAVITLMALCFVFSMNSAVFAEKKWKGKAKNIIFMVPDGMGISYVTAARIFKNGPDGDMLSLEDFSQIGYQRTHSANSTVTDSAAAAGAWACGEKFLNGEISCHDDDLDGTCNAPITKTVLELAKDKGKATGLVATSTITHATPAVWGAHVHIRKCETEIGRQLALVTNVDVLLGGGIGSDTSACKTPSALSIADIIDEAQTSKGYTYVTTKDEMFNAVDAHADKILGLFTQGGKNIEYFRLGDDHLYGPYDPYPIEEPTLADMTAAALKVLEKDSDGFFLMVEGSQIDWAGHANDIDYLISEMLGFDAAVDVVKDWLAAGDDRMGNTLVIVVADHETGGMMIDGPYGLLSEVNDIIDAGWTSGSHSAQDTIIWSQGPGSQKLGKALDNTDLYGVMVHALK
jgi:alkaline phosphatase